MKSLLIVFHTPSENTLAMAQAMEKAANGQQLDNLNVVLKTPFET